MVAPGDRGHPLAGEGDKPLGKTRRKLNRKVKKQGKGSVKVNAFVTFVPAGVAGMPNTVPVKTKLIKKRKRKKK